MKYCPNCGSRIENNVRFCPDCGAMQQEKAGIELCPFCAEEISADAVVCVHCGRQIRDLKASKVQDPNVKECNKWIAFFLCLFFGFVGFHKFYEGKKGMGILYIFTVGLLGIGAFIDLIVILCKPTTYYIYK